MHYEHTNNESTSATVALKRNSLTELVSLSGRPQITYAKPWRYGDTGPGYPHLIASKTDNTISLAEQDAIGNLQIQGYSFNHVTNIYVSGCIYDHSSSLSAIS